MDFDKSFFTFTKSLIATSFSLMLANSALADNVVIHNIDKIDKDYRSMAPAFIAPYTSMDQVEAFNKSPNAIKSFQGNNQPDLIVSAYNPTDKYEVDVAIYYPQACAQNLRYQQDQGIVLSAADIAKCPFFPHFRPSSLAIYQKKDPLPPVAVISATPLNLGKEQITFKGNTNLISNNLPTIPSLSELISNIIPVVEASPSSSNEVIGDETDIEDIGTKINKNETEVVNYEATNQILNNDGAATKELLKDKPLPVVVFSHAGGFLFRIAYYDANYYRRIANTMNVVVAVPRYRMSYEAPYPAPVQDSYAAITTLQEKAHELKINLNQFYLMGASAGGGLVYSLALYNRDHDNFKINGIISLYPMLDYRTGSNKSPFNATYTGEICWDGPSNQFAWTEYGNAKLLSAMSDDNNDYLGYYSPYHARSLKNIPKSFIYVGDIDLFSNESLSFASKLINSGNSVEIHLVPGLYHLFDLANPEAVKTKRYYFNMFSFLDRLILNNHIASEQNLAQEARQELDKQAQENNQE